MDKHLLQAAMLLAAGSIVFYAGYLLGTHRMAEAYGEAMGAEALMYLAAKDSQE